jgi:hypothetical protein
VFRQIFLGQDKPSIQYNFYTFTILKKIIFIFLIANYLLSTTQLRELLKLPILVQHYIEHKQANKTLSFIEFLAMHYTHDSTKYADYDKDMKLPFKAMDNTNISIISFCSPIPFFSYQSIVYCTNNNQEQFSDYSFTYSSAFLSSIWQPPKSC